MKTSKEEALAIVLRQIEELKQRFDLFSKLGLPVQADYHMVQDHTGFTLEAHPAHGGGFTLSIVKMNKAFIPKKQYETYAVCHYKSIDNMALRSSTRTILKRLKHYGFFK